MICEYIEMLLTFLLSRYEVFQKIDGDLVIRRQVDSGIYGEEVVALALALILRRKLLGRDLCKVSRLSLYLLIWVILHIN